MKEKFCQTETYSLLNIKKKILIRIIPSWTFYYEPRYVVKH